MEDYFILQNIIQQGLDGGYLKDSIKEGKEGNVSIEIKNDRWILSNGFDIGSTWGIILNPTFGEILWGEGYVKNLTDLVVLSQQDRINYLNKFVKVEKVVVEAEIPEEEVEPPADALTLVIRESYDSLKEISFGLYQDACRQAQNSLKDIVHKNSIMELGGDDFVIMNAVNRSMEGGLLKFLSENGKVSFTKCPECGESDFTHTEDCSMEHKVQNWFISQNDGC